MKNFTNTFSQFYVCFGRFARFRKYEFRKVLQISVSQVLVNRFSVTHFSQGFRNGQFADIIYPAFYVCNIVKFMLYQKFQSFRRKSGHGAQIDRCQIRVRFGISIKF